MKKAKTMLVVLLAMFSLGAQAQISKEIVDIMNKSAQAMETPAGLEMQMNIRAGVSVFSMKGTVILYSKGDNMISRTTMKMLGREIKIESGSVGTQHWTFKSKLTADEKDTLLISSSKPKKGGDDDYTIDFELHKEYRKASMKTKSDKYIITFSDPIDPEDPKKTIITINKSNYHVMEVDAKEGLVSMKMTVTKLKFGVNENIFHFDIDRYPGAVVVRK